MTPPSGNRDKNWKNFKINDLKALEKDPRRLKDQKKEKPEENHSLSKVVGKNCECVAFCTR